VRRPADARGPAATAAAGWAPAVPRPLLALGVWAGVAASAVYFRWWVTHGLAGGPWAVPLLAFAAFYVVVQVYCAWFLYLSVDVPAPASAPAGLSVDVLVPAYDEPYELVERALAAAVAIRYPHRTYLLDDARDPRFAALAERVGAIHLTRPAGGGAKAGNVNAALARTDGEFVAVFDVDHVPEPDFLDVALGHFADPALAFVQSGVSFRNRDESFVARATAQQAEDIYGPTSMGMHGAGAAVVWGSHTTFRRAALASIGGYQIGLAEDLHTSMRLHAAGWRSIYLPTVHAHGLVPGDFRGFTRQQLKWARGVFEVLVAVFPRLARGLAPGQRAAYVVRLTYYLVGPVFLLHALFAARALLAGRAEVRAEFAGYVLHGVPLAAAFVLVRRLANAVPAGSPGTRGFNVWGYAQACALWPVYTLGLLCALLRVPIPHLSTPKERAPHPQPLLAAPQIALLVGLAAAVTWRCVHGTTPADLIVLLFAVAAGAANATAVYAALRP
jgi:cellulose synthase (UDP-forming)